MKKLMSKCLAVVLMIALSVPAFAATTNEVINEINKGFSVNGVTVNIPGEYKKVATDFVLNAGLTEGELDTLLGNIKEGKQIWIESGATSISSMPKNFKDKLVNLAYSSAEAVGVKLTISGNSITVVDKNGKVYFVGGGTGNSSNSGSSAGGNNVIKDTGKDSNLGIILPVSIIIICAGAGVFAFGIKKYGKTK